MKKLVLPALALMMAAPALAQCTFDNMYNGQPSGTYPASLPAVQACVGCGDATRVVNVVAVTDTAVVVIGNNVTIYIDAMKVLTLTGNPVGTTYGTEIGPGPSGMGEWFNLGTIPNQNPAQGCVYISGTEAVWNSALNGGPNSDGVYPLTITVDARIGSTNPPLTGLINPGTYLSAVPANLGGGAIVFDQYSIVVVAGTAVGVGGPEGVALNNHFPNPANTEVVFNLGKHEGARLQVFNIHGALVMDKKLNGHVPRLDVTVLVPGTYVYRLADENGQLLATRKLSVVR